MFTGKDLKNGNRINGLEDTMKRYEAVLSRTTVARYNNGMIEDLQKLRSKVCGSVEEFYKQSA